MLELLYEVDPTFFLILLKQDRNNLLLCVEQQNVECSDIHSKRSDKGDTRFFVYLTADFVNHFKDNLIMPRSLTSPENV